MSGLFTFLTSASQPLCFLPHRCSPDCLCLPLPKPQSWISKTTLLSSSLLFSRSPTRRLLLQILSRPSTLTTSRLVWASDDKIFLGSSAPSLPSRYSLLEQAGKVDRSSCSPRRACCWPLSCYLGLRLGLYLILSSPTKKRVRRPRKKTQESRIAESANQQKQKVREVRVDL